jgi:hypothetical protein
LTAARASSKAHAVDSDGLVGVSQISDLLAPKQPFVYALECRQTGNAFVKYSDSREPSSEIEDICHIDVIWLANLSMPVAQIVIGKLNI